MVRSITMAEFEGTERALRLLECYTSAPQLSNKSDVIEMRKYLPQASIGSANLSKLTAALRRHY